MYERRKTTGKQVLDYSVADQMLRSGRTQQQVADHFGVTQSAVAAARRRGMLKEGATNVTGGMPWKLPLEHRNRNIPKMLRCAARLADGREVSKSNQLAARQFLEGLRRADAVIHYDPDVAPYFFRVPRREGVDKWLVREPK